jgi:DNA-binding NarL/FixJ family response regulator
VLIVEDELFVAWHLESIVEDLDFEPCGTAADGEGAIAAARDARPDLILMDVNLRGPMDGIEAAGRITAEDPHARVVFITAYSDAATLGRIHATLPQAKVLAKPTSAAKLRSAFEAVLQSPN